MVTGKYTPNTAVAGDMGWEPVLSKQLECVLRQFCRFLEIRDTRTNKIVYKHCQIMASRQWKNWNCIVKELLNKYDCEEYIDIDNLHLHKHYLLNKMQYIFLTVCV